MIMSWLVMFATLLYNSSSIFGGHQWMQGRNIPLLGMILDMHLHGEFKCAEELRRLPALESYISVVIKVFAIHPNMGPALCGYTCWQKLRSECFIDWQCWKLLNWVVWQSMKQVEPSSGCTEVEEFQYQDREGNSYLTSRLIHIEWNDRKDAQNWPLRTLKLLKFTKTHGITTSCYDLFQLRSHGMGYHITSYDGHKKQ